MIDVFIEIYNRGLNVFEIDPMRDMNYRTYLLKKQGNPVKIVQTTAILDLIVKLPEFARKFFYRQQYFWLIPFETIDNQIYTFQLRGLTDRIVGNKKLHDYWILPFKKDTPPIFGFYDFEDYQCDQPIILTEGTKDALALKTLYKYTVAMTTAGVSEVALSILGKFSSKFILAFDSDKAGLNAIQEDGLRLQKRGYRAIGIPPVGYSGVKDYGDCLLNNPTLFSLLKLRLQTTINELNISDIPTL